MSQHKVTWLRFGTNLDGVDWDEEQVITFEYRPGSAPILYPPDCAHPGEPDSVEFISISPGAGDHGAFTDIAQKDLESDAADWLQGDGYDEALAVVAADDERGREFAADLRADR